MTSARLWALVLPAVAVLLASCGTATRTAPAAGTTPATGHGMHDSAAPAKAAAALREGERFATVTMEHPYSPAPPNGGTDEYRCFLIDPKLAADGFLTGTQFAAQNSAIVHHAIFFRVGPGDVAQVRDVDAAQDGEGWRCFGNAGVQDADWIGHWAPGTDEVLLDQNLGYPMPAGSALVIQVHYSTLALDGGPAGSDQSGVRLRLSSKPLTPLRTELFQAPIELPCTSQESGPLCDRKAAIADVSRRFDHSADAETEMLLKWCNDGKLRPGPTQRCDQKIEQPVTLHALAGHMHLLGRSIKVELNPGKPGAKALLDVPEYNFDNQALQPLPSPMKLRRGDVVRVTCTHDASLRARLPLLKKLPPRYVVWGEGTQDEMCLGIAVVSAA
ncbi:monooxygenase [Nonomuraea sp. NBC_01738]|uniref:monooxygenase n=1 Tax=Nonomuraea sp. NBC_01738 TaxID=2976003 RepID=UPI002E11AEF6|nr:monooxygenase [Nonomuraea sp. NBC_01738]